MPRQNLLTQLQPCSVNLPNRWEESGAMDAGYALNLSMPISHALLPVFIYSAEYV